MATETRNVPVDAPAPAGMLGQALASKAIFDALSDGVTLQDASGRVVYANPAAVRLMGFADAPALLQATPEDLAVRWDVFDDAGRPLTLQDLPGRQALQGRDGAERVVRFRVRATGEERWSAVSASPLLDPAGRVAGAVNLFRDVTDERRLHDRHAFLAEAGAILSRSLDPDAVLAGLARLAVPRLADWASVHLVRPDGRFEAVEVAHVDAAKAALGREIARRWPPSPADPHGVADVVRTGRSLLAREIPREALEGAARDDEHRAMLLATESRSCVIVPLQARGRVLGALTLTLAGANPRRYGPDDVAFAEDLAARVAVAVDNARLYREADTSRQRLDELVNGVEGILWEADAETFRFTFVSQRARDLLGHPVERWLSEDSFWADHIHPLDRAWAVDFCASRTHEGKDHEFEYRMLAADGRVVWVRDVVYVIKDAEGRPARLRGLMTDVTSRKRAETRLAAQDAVTRALAEARGVEEAQRGVLAAVTAHLGWDAGAVWRAEGETLRCAHAWHAQGVPAAGFADATRALALAPGEGLPGRVWREGRPLWIADFGEDGSIPRAGHARAAGLRVAVGVPVAGASGARGVLELLSRDARVPDEDLLSLLAGFGHQLGLFLERAAAEEALRESNARRGAVLEASLDCIVTIDRHGRVTEWNPTAERTFGWSRAEAMGREMAELIVPPGMRDAHRAGLARLAASGDPRVAGRRLEMPAMRRDGAVFPAELAIVALPGQDGPLYTGFLRDITDRKRADETLKRIVRELDAQRARLDTIIRSVPGVVWEAWGEPDAAQQRIDFVSDHVQSMLGYTVEEWLSTPNFWLSIVHPDDRERAARESREHFERGQGGTLQFRWRRKDGAYLWCQAWNTVVKDPDGRPVGMRGVTLDVTDRRKADEALRASEERYRFVAENSGDMISRHAPDTTFLWVSPAVRRILGYEPEELIGRRSLDFVHPDDVPVGNATHDTVVQTPEVATLTLRYRRKDGSYVWLEASARTVRDPATDEPVEIVASSRDVTARKMAEERLREARERLGLALDAASLGAWDLDVASDTAIRSLRHDQIFGYPEGVADWGAARFFSHVDPAHVPAVKEAFETAFRTGRLAFECLIRRADGAPAWISAQGLVVHEGGGPMRMLGVVADVTERRKAEEALRESEARYRFLAENGRDMITRSSPEGRLLYVSPAVRHLLGYEPEDLVGRVSMELVHPEDVERVRRERAEIAKRDDARVVTLRFRRKDGEYVWLEAVAQAVHDPKTGALVEFVGASRDVTERKLAEQALQDRAEQLARLTADLQYQTDLMRTITDNTGSALFLIDRRGHPIFMNPAAKAMTGYASLDEIKDRPLHDAVHFRKPDGTPYPMEECPIDQANAAIMPLKDQRETFCRKDGTLFPVAFNVAPILKGGTEMGAVLEVRDVTEDERRERALREQARTLATLNRINTQLAAELDLDRLVQSVTDAATELTGARYGAFFYNQQDERGEGYMLYTVSGAPREAFGRFPMPRVTEVFGPTFRGEAVIRLDDVTKDPRYGRNPPHHGMPQGHLPVRSYLAVPVVSRLGKPIGGLFFGHPEAGVFTDQAEQLAAGIAAQAAIALDNASLYRSVQTRAEDLGRLASALERSNRELDQFAYVTSHDLKAPLRGIANLSRWIEEDLGDRVTPEARQHLDLLRGRVARMEGLIDAILEYSRVGRRTGKVEPVRVRDLLADVVDLLAPPPGFSVRLPDEMPTVVTERARLQQVFMNLLGNAIKHHPSKESGVVSIGVEDAGDRWRFTVSDNGRGIPRRFHDKVFVIFQTLEARDKVEGAGIGLAIVKKVVESKGGRVELDSDEGKGATFRFTWPKQEQGDD